jgi:hypothetical protein
MATLDFPTFLRRTTRRTSVFVAALALAGAQGRVAAQQVNACYVPSVGAVYVIGPGGLPTECLPSHVPATLGSNSLADGSVITIKLANGAVTIAKLSFDPATQTELDVLAVPGTINDPNNPVHWTKLKGVPAEFADGTDNVGGAGGSVTSITAGAGLVAAPNPITTTGTLRVNFAGPGAADSVARSDHTHAAPVETDPTWTGPADIGSDIARDGNVGIGPGTGLIDAKLTIVADALNEGLRILNSGTNRFGLRIVNGVGAHHPLAVVNASNESVLFNTTGNPGSAVNIANTGTGHALRIDDSNGGNGLYVNNSGGGFAGYFTGSSADVVIQGNLDVAGTISKGGGSFAIDHPLDPDNMILRHSFVESPDMMNVYNGVVTTDSLGAALVELPTYFEALNRDFRYQLTVIGQFAQAIITEEVQNNRFAIRTSEPRVKVSWQVTGIRKDRWAEEHRIVVEEAKLQPR